ncbi:MAG: YibE/F family protein [bacterium]|nr:YibE/F family protein [bacterium]
MKKILVLSGIALAVFLFAPPAARAQDAAAPQETFKAIVIRILEERQVTAPDEKGREQTLTRQKLRLRGLNGAYRGKEFAVNLLDDQNTLNKAVYKVWDQVLVMYSADEQGGGEFFITDFVRTKVLFWLFVFFAAAVLLVGRIKGLRSLISLALTFLVLIKFIIPRILDGADPVMITVIGSIAILFIIIYLTEGVNMKSHITSVSILLSLVFTVYFSWLLIHLASLSGLSNEEAGFIVNLGAKTLNLQGVLLAGIIIGTLGALDDVIIAQVATVEELHLANPGQSRGEILKKALNVGVSHISAMSNTLFLAYAGASLPLLILFVSGQSAFASWDIAMNNEMLATEIIRALAGTIGIVLSVPLATIISVWWFKRNN